MLVPTLHRQVHTLTGKQDLGNYGVMMLGHGEPESPGYSAKFLLLCEMLFPVLSAPYSQIGSSIDRIDSDEL
jgi:hypothetical protein